MDTRASVSITTTEFGDGSTNDQFYVISGDMSGQVHYNMTPGHSANPLPQFNVRCTEFYERGEQLVMPRNLTNSVSRCIPSFHYSSRHIMSILNRQGSYQCNMALNILSRTIAVGQQKNIKVTILIWYVLGLSHLCIFLRLMICSLATSGTKQSSPASIQSKEGGEDG